MRRKLLFGKEQVAISEIDAGVILRIVDNVSEDNSLEFCSVFKNWFQQRLNVLHYDQLLYSEKKDKKAELKAILICFSMALMNVVDIADKEEFELIPFMKELRSMKDETGKFCFDQSIRVFAWILFGISESSVSSLYFFLFMSICIFLSTFADFVVHLSLCISLMLAIRQ